MKECLAAVMRGWFGHSLVSQRRLRRCGDLVLAADFCLGLSLEL